MPKDVATNDALMTSVKEFDPHFAQTLTSKKLASFLKKHGCQPWRNNAHRGWTFPPLNTLRARWTKIYDVRFDDDDMTSWGATYPNNRQDNGPLLISDARPRPLIANL